MIENRKFFVIANDGGLYLAEIQQNLAGYTDKIENAITFDSYIDAEAVASFCDTSIKNSDTDFVYECMLSVKLA